MRSDDKLSGTVCESRAFSLKFTRDDGGFLRLKFFHFCELKLRPYLLSDKTDS